MLKTSVLITLFFGISLCSNAEIIVPKNSQIQPTPYSETIKHNPINKDQITTGQKLNLLVWNIYKQGRKNLIEDLQTFSKKNDILVLQETHLTEHFENNIVNPPLLNHHSIMAPSFDYRGYPTGVSTTTRYNYLHAFPLRSPVKEPILGTSKMSLYVSLPIIGSTHPLMIANVHGINFVGQSSFTKHMEQVFTALQDHPGPIVLAGDFNTRNKERMDLVIQLANDTGLNIVPLKNDQRRIKLDLVLARGVDIHSAQLLSQIKSSDHPPIELSLSVPSKETYK